MQAPIPNVKNGVLRTLEPEDLALINGHLSLVDLKRGAVLSNLNVPTEYTLFVEDGVLSVAAASPAGRAVEVLKIGREGFFGMPALLSVKPSVTATVQMAGQGHMIRGEVLTTLMNKRPTICTALMCYVSVSMAQTAETAFAHAVGTLRQKIARWILMTLDRIDDVVFPFTHEELARMLGARRASVTIGVQELEGTGAIAVGRALITLRDRALLTKSAGEGYGIIFPRPQTNLKICAQAVDNVDSEAFTRRSEGGPTVRS